MTGGPYGGAMATAGAGVLALVGAAALAALATVVHPLAGGAPERGVALAGAVLAAPVATVLGGYAVVRRGRLTATELGPAALLALSVVLGGSYLFWVAPSIRFPADILIWAESPFVADLVKLRLDYPLYSAPANLESFHYTPGTQLLTYGIARLAGSETSLPFLRTVQLGFATAAALVATHCVNLLARLAEPTGPRPPGRLPLALGTMVLFLTATNGLTNQFTHLLHNDSLALLVNIVGYWLVLAYATSRSRRLLVAMAVLPVAGFLVKQPLAVWAGLFGLYLLLFDRPRSPSRIIGYGAATAALLAITYIVCKAIWGPPFDYWVIGLEGRAVSPFRVALHALEAWPYGLAGIAGLWLLLPAAAPARLIGTWSVWLLLGATEAYTSGIAWMLNHLGPASLVGMVWLCAGLAGAWPRWTDAVPARVAWWRTALLVAGAAFASHGLGWVRVPQPSVTPRHLEYVAAIERAFEDLPADRVLLDDGSWLYARAGVLQKDRGASAADLGYAGTADFSGLFQRLRERWYGRILVRGLDRGELEYDDAEWRRRSGVQDSLLAHYRVVGELPEVPPGRGWRTRQFNTISVLEPRE